MTCHPMGFWRHSNGTRSLAHLLTLSIRINLFIKVRLNTLLLPPLLSSSSSNNNNNNNNNNDDNNNNNGICKARIHRCSKRFTM